MDTLDFTYQLAAALAGAWGRSCRRGLPPGWRLRLEAEPPELPARAWVWVHAVSVGELLLAEGLVGRLRDAGHWIHVTTGTVAGLDLLGRRLPSLDGGTHRVTGGAFPLDDAAGLEPFLLRPPGAFICLETELWPGLLQALEARGVPRLVVNGRLTARSLERGGPWLHRAAARLTQVAARDEDSAEAFSRLGSPRVALGGNLKADLPAPPPLHAGWAGLRAAWAGDPVVVAGNSLAGEETLILGAWQAARSAWPGLRLILAPRQPRRFEAVAQLLAAQGLPFRRASGAWESEAAWGEVPILLLDTLGELAGAYAEGTVALVAGGWVAEGGHNPLESVRAGVPTLVGPGFANFTDLVPPLRQAGLLEVVPAEALGERLCAALAASPLRAGAEPALPRELTGALARTWNLLAPHLPPVG